MNLVLLTLAITVTTFLAHAGGGSGPGGGGVIEVGENGSYQIIDFEEKVFGDDKMEMGPLVYRACLTNGVWTTKTAIAEDVQEGCEEEYTYQVLNRDTLEAFSHELTRAEAAQVLIKQEIALVIEKGDGGDQSVGKEDIILFGACHGPVTSMLRQLNEANFSNLAVERDGGLVVVSAESDFERNVSPTTSLLRHGEYEESYVFKQDMYGQDCEFVSVTDSFIPVLTAEQREQQKRQGSFAGITQSMSVSVTPASQCVQTVPSPDNFDELKDGITYEIQNKINFEKHENQTLDNTSQCSRALRAMEEAQK